MIEPKVKARVLSDEQIAEIHGAAMKVLAETGCEFQHEGALKMLGQAGAKVDGRRVRIPAEMVAKAIESAPASVTLGDRDGKPAMELAGDNVYFGTGSDCLYVLDGPTGERREAMLEDVRRFAHVADKLEEIDFVMSMACPHDVPADRLYREQFAAMLTSTSKPIVFTVIDPAELGPILEMSVACQPGKEQHSAAPHLLLYAEPISPLIHPDTSVEKIIFCAANRVPITYCPGPMGGGTSPVTGAGTIVLSLVEILSGLVLHQLVQPGAPFVFGAALGPLDMSTMSCVYAGPFGTLWQAATVEIGRHYGLPTWSLAGASDAKIVDGQATLESALMILVAALNGANLVHDVGYESGKTSSLEMLAISAEVIALVKRMVEGVRTDAGALAVEAIGRVGPGGSFLGDDHTLDNFRREMFTPMLLDYRNFAEWQAGGGTSLLDRAKRRVKELLAEPANQLDAARLSKIMALTGR